MSVRRALRYYGRWLCLTFDPANKAFKSTRSFIAFFGPLALLVLLPLITERYPVMGPRVSDYLTYIPIFVVFVVLPVVFFFAPYRMHEEQEQETEKFTNAHQQTEDALRQRIDALKKEIKTEEVMSQLIKDTEYSKEILNTLAQLGAKHFGASLDQRARGTTDISRAQEPPFSVEDTLQELILGPKSRHSPQGKLAYLERRAFYLRLDLENAALRDKRPILNRLVQALARQLDLEVHQRPSDQYKVQFDAITEEIERLHDLERDLKQQGY